LIGSHISDNLSSVHRQLNKANNELVELREVQIQANEINSLQKDEIKTLRTGMSQLNITHQQSLNEVETRVKTLMDDNQVILDRSLNELQSQMSSMRLENDKLQLSYAAIEASRQIADTNNKTIFKNNKNYTGSVVNGNPHGHGVMKGLDCDGNDDIYDGEWVNGQRHGQENTV